MMVTERSVVPAALLLAHTHQQRQHGLRPGDLIPLGQLIPVYRHAVDGVAAPVGIQRRGIVQTQALLLLLNHTAAGQCQQYQRQRRQHDEFSLHVGSPPSSGLSFARGRRTVNIVPEAPCRAAAVICPPRLSTVSLTMERPSPVPPMARERILSTR